MSDESSTYPADDEDFENCLPVPKDFKDYNVEEARKVMEECYCGCHSSVADYAQELTEDTGDIPKHLEIVYRL